MISVSQSTRFFYKNINSDVLYSFFGLKGLKCSEHVLNFLFFMFLFVLLC